jgi:predicted TIM-barrel fold metal-dependent hydrolase
MADDKKRYVFQLNRDIVVQFGKDIPITDAHMHIQSNDIAPIPIMYGVININIVRMLHGDIEIKILRAVTDKELVKKINFANLSYLSTENDKKIAPIKDGGALFLDFANNKKIEISLFNAAKELPKTTTDLLNTVTIIIGIALGLKVKIVTPILLTLAVSEIGKTINLTDNEKRKHLTNLIASLKLFIKDYGKIARQNSFFIAGMYKNDSIMKSEMGTNSRKVHIEYDDDDKKKGRKEREDLVKSRTSQREQKIFLSVSDHYYAGQNNYYYEGRKAVRLVPSFTMSIVHGMELMYAHYWGAYGIPIYIQYGQDLYYITDNLIDPKNKDVKCYNIYDTNKDDINKLNTYPSKPDEPFPLKDRPILKNCELGENGVKYTHFLKKVPDSEKEQFEDLTKHVEYTKAAVVRYPLEYLPFYHVDPRRFFAPVESIGKFHDFCICDNNEFNLIDGSEIQRSITSDNTIFKYNMNIKQEVKENLIYHKEDGTLTKGLFWGIKMYAALGYPPYLGVKSKSGVKEAAEEEAKAKKAFYCLGNEDYNCLLKMYNFCAENEVPITCHGSPQGMTIADPGTYLKEFLKNNSDTGYGEITKNDFPVDGKSYMYGIGLIDSFSSPESWRVVLDALDSDNKQKLKLCLAHFGGKKFFSGEKDADSPYDWLNGIAELVKDFDGVYTDISCFVYDYFVPMPQFISMWLYNKVKNKIPNNFIDTVYKYTNRGSDTPYEYSPDRSIDKRKLALLRLYIILEYPRYKIELKCYEGIYNTAQKLSKLISKNEKLQHRILFGTDWPMSEMNVKGVLRYSGAIFVMLQLVTVLLNNEWDAWHQFAVINPLRFLGLLEDPNDNLDTYELKIDKITEMKGAIEEHLNNVDEDADESYKKDYDIDPTKLKGRLKDQYQYMKNIAKQDILSAKQIVDVDNKLLLTNMARGSKIL